MRTNRLVRTSLSRSAVKELADNANGENADASGVAAADGDAPGKNSNCIVRRDWASEPGIKQWDLKQQLMQQKTEENDVNFADFDELSEVFQ